MQPAPVTRPIVDRPTNLTEIPGRNEAFSAGVSWPAVVGGAFVAASLSLILLTLGTGLGLSVVSPSLSLSEAASRVGMGAIAWLIITQIIAFSFGGYVAGRLRTKWVQVHTDEVFFRDTAHGLLVWAVGAVMAAVLLAWAASSAVSGAAHVAGAATEAVGSATSQVAGQAASAMGDPTAYFSDMLWRSDKPAQGDQAARAGLIALQASIRAWTEATDLANMAFSLSSNAISMMRSTPLAPITTGTPT